jgi:hypothetical protein
LTDVLFRSVQRLCEQDSPALATMRMQVDFDGACVAPTFSKIYFYVSVLYFA